MFDTNIFNHILDGNIDPGIFVGKKCYATHIQLDEIRDTPVAERRSELESIFLQARNEQITTESFILDVSRLDEAKLSSGVFYDQLLQRLNQLNKSKSNNKQDTLIAETAMVNHLILVTDENDLARVVSEFGGQVCNLKALLEKGGSVK